MNKTCYKIKRMGFQYLFIQVSRVFVLHQAFTSLDSNYGAILYHQRKIVYKKLTSEVNLFIQHVNITLITIALTSGIQ